jgi:hypothetical protein
MAVAEPDALAWLRIGGRKLPDVARRPTVFEIDESLLDAVRRVASADRRPEGDILDEALRRYFGLRGLAVLDDIADNQAVVGTVVDDDEAMSHAVVELRAARADRARRASA